MRISRFKFYGDKLGYPRVGPGQVCAQPRTDPITSGFLCLDVLPTDERSQFRWLDFHWVQISPWSILSCEKICRILPKVVRSGKTWLDLDDILADLKEIRLNLDQIWLDLDEILAYLEEIRLNLDRSDRKHRKTTITDGKRRLFDQYMVESVENWFLNLRPTNRPTIFGFRRQRPTANLSSTLGFSGWIR